MEASALPFRAGRARARSWSASISGFSVTARPPTKCRLAPPSARLQPRAGRFRPYAEALLFIRTSVEETGLSGRRFGDAPSDEIASSVNFDDFALSGGVEAGIDIRVYRQSGSAKNLRRVDLHLGAEYLLGQEAEYLAEGSLTDENGDGQLEESEMEVRRSRTTFLQPQLGVTVRLADTD